MQSLESLFDPRATQPPDRHENAARRARTVSGSKLTQDEDGDSIKDGAYVGQQPHDHSQLREKQRATQRAQDQRQAALTHE